ncbi:hypothetical protein ACHAXA_011260 [Cyclostephanos tholiformis]|uniref:BTB domain-containing protein n=1 Tax=Cyclostephanos tholiformis TaxID=382380 RepID=A0ABD3SPZ9_9STRA
MKPYIDTSPHPTSCKGRSIGMPPPFPSHVVLKHSEKSRDATAASSHGTGPTWIGTSPLSADQDFHSIAMRYRKPEMEFHRGKSFSHNVDDGTVSNQKSIETKISHQHDNRTDGYLSSRPTQRERKNNRKSERHNNLTWRMEPTISLSDFTLTIIAVDDKDAVAKFRRERRNRQKNTRRSRRDKWMVESLYLDMSQSASGDDENGDNCCNAGVNDEEQLRNIRVHSTSSRSKTLNYSVVEKYHLHKVNLAVGLRSCGYFTRLFRRQDDDSNKSEHNLEVPISCLPAIPAMLDYLYNSHPNAEVNATTATAIPLRYLGALLRNPTLFDSATRFLQKDLCTATAVEYLKHADLFRQKKLADVCVRICAESFDQLKITWFASLAPCLMKRILHSKYFTRSINSWALCSKIASFCRCQSQQIDIAMLLSLTDAKIMPYVCPEEALFFIQILLTSGMDMEDLTRDDYISSKERSLYERCIDAAPTVLQGVVESLCQGGNTGVMRLPGGCHIRPNQRKKACNDYSRLPPQIKVDLLEYALAQQQIGHFR